MAPRRLGARAIKAEGVCRLVLPGVSTCSPFEEGILHMWMGGWVVQQLGWGCRGGFTKGLQGGGGVLHTIYRLW